MFTSLATFQSLPVLPRFAFQSLRSIVVSIAHSALVSRALQNRKQWLGAFATGTLCGSTSSTSVAVFSFPDVLNCTTSSSPHPPTMVVIYHLVIPPLPARSADPSSSGFPASHVLRIPNQSKDASSSENHPTSPSKPLQDAEKFKEIIVGGISIEFWDSLSPPPEHKTSIFDTIAPMPESNVDPMWHCDPVDCYGYDVDPDYDYDYVPMTAVTPTFSQEIMMHESFGDPVKIIANICPKMMFVSGETGETSNETTWLIEEIVREQVIHMVSVVFPCFSHYLTVFSSSNPVSNLPTAEARNPLTYMISCSKSDTINRNSLVSRPFSAGRMCARTSKTLTTKAVAMPEIST